MSIFRSIKISCPACQNKVEFDAVHSVNADRRPDLRAAILDESFQQQLCSRCGTKFRLDPEFNLMDTKRGQWIAAAPVSELPNWVEAEKHARELFDRAHGPDSNPMAQSIGKNLQPRITFGWPALREKLLASEFLLQDVVLELCKMFIMRNSDSPVSADTELRLINVVNGDLVFGWVMTADEAQGPTLLLERTVYDQIAEDEDGEWEEMKAVFDGAYFVDLNRLLMDDRPASARQNQSPTPVAAPPATAVAESPVAVVEDDEEEVDDLEPDEDEDAGGEVPGDAPE